MFKKIALLASMFTLGVLFAPKSGKENRKDLKNGLNRKYKEMKEKVRR